MAEEEDITKTAEAPDTPEGGKPSAGDSGSAQAEESATPAGDAQVAGPAPAAEPDWKDLYTRLSADFDNYRKRMNRDREDAYRFAEADILKDILPVADNLSLALSAVKDSEKDDAFVKGLRLVSDTLLSAMKSHSAEPFDSVGKTLDTDRMEAIATLPSADVEEGKVMIESKKGWTLKGKVLRAAQVVVSAGAPASQDSPEEKNG